MSQRKSMRSEKNSRSQIIRNAEIDLEEENHIVGMVIRYLFANNRLKTAIHGDQIKKNYLAGSSQNYSSIIIKVKQTLQEIFGYELIDIGGLKYILVNKINNPYLESSNKDAAENTLLFLTLTYIFMSCDNEATPFAKEDDLWEYFTNLKIIKDENFQHHYFGNVRRLITVQFVDQLYLTRRKIPGTEEIVYEWGPRANAEITRRSILEFVSKVYNDRPIESWPAQAGAMRESEKLNIQGNE
ncbi:hypothetical protein PV326_011585 [Microctonus aethiopoides]|nr:hypothetical protein PV326_011585 [Microctonus aethiopoides]